MGPEADSRMFCAHKTRSECRHVQNNHDEREKIHSHRNANPDVHCTNANQPNLSRLAVPDKKRICDFQEGNKYSCNWEQVLPSHEYLRIDNVERRADESAPYTRSIPPASAEAFRKAAEKVDDAQVELKDPPPKTEKLWILRLRFSQSPVQRISVRQRRQHQIEQANRQEIIHPIGDEASGFRRAQV